MGDTKLAGKSLHSATCQWSQNNQLMSRMEHFTGKKEVWRMDVYGKIWNEKTDGNSGTGAGGGSTRCRT